MQTSTRYDGKRGRVGRVGTRCKRAPGYDKRGRMGVFEHNANFIMNMSLSKTFKKWNCTLNFNDVFRDTIYNEQFAINGVTSKARYVVDAHEISIAIKYSFGKIKETEFKGKTIDENENRIR